MVRRILEVAADAFHLGGIALPSRLRDYLERWVKESTAALRYRLELLREQNKRLPKQLWTGSGGNIWRRIIRYAVYQNGGTVTGHDHANGVGHLKYYYLLLTDFESCDRFVTFTKKQCENLKKNIRKDWLIPDRPPEMSFINTMKQENSLPQTNSFSKIQTIKTVMYISSNYTGERFQFGIQIPDYIQVDWEARLFAHLHKWGYRVLHKPHPESVEMPPENLYHPFNVVRLHKPFEQVMNQADAVLFVNPQSTALVHAFKSNIPLVFLDLGMFEWMPDAYELLEKRCQIVKGKFDEQYRAQIDWDELQKKIPDSLHKIDTSFVEQFVI